MLWRSGASAWVDAFRVAADAVRPSSKRGFLRQRLCGPPLAEPVWVTERGREVAEGSSIDRARFLSTPEGCDDRAGCFGEAEPLPGVDVFRVAVDDVGPFSKRGIFRQRRCGLTLGEPECKVGEDSTPDPVRLLSTSEGRADRAGGKKASDECLTLSSTLNCFRKASTTLVHGIGKNDH